VHHGDTLYAYTEVVSTEPAQRGDAGIVGFAMGLKPHAGLSSKVGARLVKRGRCDAVVNRQRERSERSTRALLDAACEVIAEVGYGNMTLAASAEGPVQRGW
jgi:hypothetical protein